MTSTQLQLTVITKPNGILTKKVSKDSTGNFKKDATECRLSTGTGQVFTLKSLQELTGLIAGLEKNQALTHGVPIQKNLPESFSILSEKNFKKQPNTITRTKKDFEYSNDSNHLVPIDYDPPKGQASPFKDIYELIAAIAEVLPPFKEASKLITQSTSSCINDEAGHEMTGKGAGCHIYSLFPPNTDMERFKTIFKTRAWLKGYGYIALSKSGALLERNLLFDEAVFSPERLDFVAGASLPKGWTQSLPDPIYIDGGVFDPVILPDLTLEEIAQYKQMAIDAKAAKKPDSKQVQAAYIKAQGRKKYDAIKKKNPNDARTLDACEREFSKSVISNNGDNTFDLYGDFQLYLDEYSDPITVDQILDNPEKYDLETLGDPHEPEKGRNKAKIFMNIDKGNQKPFIHSFVHGESKYFLHYSQSRIIEKAEQTILDAVKNNNIVNNETQDAFIKLQEIAPDKAANHRTLIVKKEKLIDAKTFDALIKTRKNFVAYGEEDKDIQIERLNKQHAGIMVGGLFRILNQTIDPVEKTPDFTLSTVADFHNKYANSFMPDPTNPEKIKKLSFCWLESKKRKDYKGIIFEPALNNPEYYNLFQGFAVQPTQGDWSKMQYHLKNIICKSDESLYNWTFAWYANLFQNPGLKNRTCIAFKGEQGTGKNVFIDSVGKCFGRHYKQITQERHLTGNFNAHFKDCLLLLANEVIGKANAKQKGVIKSLVTDDKISIEQKGMDIFEVKNHLNLNMASNEKFCVPAEFDERRFQVIELSTEGKDRHEKKESYFTDLIKERDNSGVAAMLYDFLHTDISGIDTNTISRTSALFEQQRMNFDSLQEYWFGRLASGCFQYSTEFQCWGCWETDHIIFPSDDQYNDYLSYCAARQIKVTEQPESMGLFFATKLGIKKKEYKKMEFKKNTDTFPF